MGEEALRTTALHLALLKAMTQHSLKRVLVYLVVHGDHTNTPTERADTFAGFAAARRAILTNAKVIAEDVDIPSIDAEPTRSIVRCVQILEVFLHREHRAPAARETITVDGETVRIGLWFAKYRTKRRAGQLDVEHECLVAALFEGDWTNTDPVPAFVWHEHSRRPLVGEAFPDPATASRAEEPQWDPANS